MIIRSNQQGISLRSIIARYGNKSYSYVEFRCKKGDVFLGCASYDSKTKVLTPLDSGEYHLADLYIESEEWVDDTEEYVDGNHLCLTVWKPAEG